MVAYLIVEKGWGKPVKGKKISKYYDDLIRAEKIAEQNESGIFGK